MEEIFEKIVFDGYGIKLYSARRIRTCLVCNTNKGLMALKKQPSDSVMVSFEGMAREKLNENGFENINGFTKTVDGNFLYTYIDDNYTLEPYVEFLSPEMEDENTVINAVKTLAKMHNAAYGLNFEGGRNALGRLPELFEKRMTELKHIKKDIKRRANYDVMDMIVKTHYNYFTSFLTFYNF